MKSGYYGIIPTNVRHHEELKPNAKLLYAEITACLEDDGVCVKRNIYFSNVLNLSKATVSNCLTSLRKSGFINVVLELEEGTQKFIKRYITLTPSNLSGGVSEEFDATHSENLGGVETNDSLENGSTPSKLPKALLYNNNIHKVYTNKANKVTPVNKEITNKQVGALMKVVKYFYTKQQPRYPKMINKDWQEDSNIVNGSINTLYEIIKKDNYNYEVVRDVITWALEDVFWSQHLLSLKTLRDKSSNGFSKFQNLYHKWKNQ